MNKDILIKLAIELDLPDIIKLCRTNHKVNNLVCKNDIFWMKKFKHDYDFPTINKPDDISWKEFYKGFNLIRRMKYNDTIFLCQTDVEFKKVCDKYPIIKDSYSCYYTDFYATLDIDSRKLLEVFYSQVAYEEGSDRYVDVINENDDYDERFRIDFTVDGKNPMNSGLMGWIAFTIKQERYNPAIVVDLYIDPKSAFNQIWPEIEEQILSNGTAEEKLLTKEDVFMHMKENEIFQLEKVGFLPIKLAEQTYHLVNINFSRYHIYYG